jgi:hypothetical protein
MKAFSEQEIEQRKQWYLERNTREEDKEKRKSS